ncbi:VOC family protein [Cellulomonas chengniuliangii]|uniref:VOC family protein n=1 Tax=Cellulomonas chengniuliangii TaxID=2968084 RepID=A0ABY5L3J7_9CELL|nr:VOC family protein [Cellulomonas chengniuliangii]MCC2308089.1 VOC family protein [Cellulomonas chengniuliangii]UUI76485.1 VOC family protein [Cellulomonas chengniuliangii]
MGIILSQVVVDSRDPASLAAWWGEVLGREVEADGEDEIWIVGESPGDLELGFIRVPEDKTVKNRLHIDLRPQDGSDQATELERLIALGARRVDVGQGPDVTWVVLADPEGNEFCLLRSTPAEVAADMAAAESLPG